MKKYFTNELEGELEERCPSVVNEVNRWERKWLPVHNWFLSILILVEPIPKIFIKGTNDSSNIVLLNGATRDTLKSNHNPIPGNIHHLWEMTADA